jgi:hypothetical protein
VTRYRVNGRDWPALPCPIPLEDVYRALEGITEEDADAAMDTLRDVRVPPGDG